MKKLTLTIINIIGAAILTGGAVFAVYWHDFNTVRYDRYRTEFYYEIPDDGTFTEEQRHRLETEQRIKYPQYYLMVNEKDRRRFSPNLIDCYDEVDCACLDYAERVAYKYHNNADLDFTVEITNDRLTIKFMGTGYPENAAPEDLSRTYIFDIEGVGANKLPKLLNRAEFIGY